MKPPSFDWARDADLGELEFLARRIETIIGNSDVKADLMMSKASVAEV